MFRPSEGVLGIAQALRSVKSSLRGSRKIVVGAGGVEAAGGGELDFPIW